MNPLPLGTRVWLAAGVSDMRRGMDSLAAQVHEMLQRDFGQARRMAAADLRGRPPWFRFAVRLARLSAPVQ